MQKKTIEFEAKGCLRGHSKPIISIDSSQSFSIIVSGSEVLNITSIVNY